MKAFRGVATAVIVLTGAGLGFGCSSPASGLTGALDSSNGAAADGGVADGGRSRADAGDPGAVSSPDGGPAGDGGADDGPDGGAATTTRSTRIIAYLPNWNGSYESWVSKIDFSQLTEINLAFVNAEDGSNDLGVGDSDASLGAFVDAAHAAHVQVFASIGGGGTDGLVTSHYGADNVDAYVAGIVRYLDAHDLDGVDVDVEKPGSMGAPYTTFVKKLKAAVSPSGRLVTAATARWVEGDDGMTDEALGVFDFVNVMTYSTYDDSVSDMTYFTESKGLPRDKVVLGVKFYADESDDSSISYRELLEKAPDAWKTDSYTLGGQKYSYVGDATMKKMATLAKGYGGIMNWELSNDAPAPHSLMTIISNEIP